MIDTEVEATARDQLAAGDLSGATTTALRGYGPAILGYLRATLSGDLADDAFSVFCELFWKGLPGFQAKSSLATWSYQVAWSAARRVLEDPYRKRARALPTTELEGIAADVRSSTAVHLRKDTSEKLAKIRGELDFAEQTLLVLRIDRAMEWSDIAEVMDTDAATLRKRFERLKDKIKKLAR